MLNCCSPDTSQFPAAVRSPLRRDIEAGIQGRGMCIGTLVLLIRASTFFNFFPDSETLLSHGLQGVSGGSLSKAGNLLLKMRLHNSLIFHRYCFMLRITISLTRKVGAYPLVDLVSIQQMAAPSSNVANHFQTISMVGNQCQPI